MLLFVATSSCSSESVIGVPDDDLEDLPIEYSDKERLEQARAKWQSNKPTKYEYVLRRLCYCLDEHILPARIVANQDTVLISYVGSGLPVHKESRYLFRLENIHFEIDQALGFPADSVKVEYDHEYGFLISFYADYRLIGPDDEVLVTISSFKDLDGN